MKFLCPCDLNIVFYFVSYQRHPNGWSAPEVGGMSAPVVGRVLANAEEDATLLSE